MQAPETLGQYIRRVRTARGYTGQAVVDVVGISNSTLTYYETGHSLPTLALLEKVLTFLNADLEYAWALYLIRGGAKKVTVPTPQDGVPLQLPLFQPEDYLVE